MDSAMRRTTPTEKEIIHRLKPPNNCVDQGKTVGDVYRDFEEEQHRIHANKSERLSGKEKSQKMNINSDDA